MAVNADMAVDIQQVDEGDSFQPGDCRDSLGIHLPFLMWALHGLPMWFWLIFMAFIFANLPLFFQVGRYPRPAGNLQTGKASGFRNFQFQCLRTPARSFFSQLQQGIRISAGVLANAPLDGRPI